MEIGSDGVVHKATRCLRPRMMQQRAHDGLSSREAMGWGGGCVILTHIHGPSAVFYSNKRMAGRDFPWRTGSRDGHAQGMEKPAMILVGAHLDFASRLILEHHIFVPAPLDAKIDLPGAAHASVKS